jgi:hypothetical protein
MIQLLSSVPALLIVLSAFRSWPFAQWMLSGRPGLFALFALYAAAGSAKALAEALSAPSVGQASLGLVVAASITAAAILITEEAGNEG